MPHGFGSGPKSHPLSQPPGNKRHRHSRARVLVTLLHEMGRRNAKKGLATLCIGGGMGVAMCLER